MKISKILAKLLGATLLITPVFAGATPLDLSSGFARQTTVSDSIQFSGGGSTLELSENAADSAIYIYDDDFLVDTNATFLSFNYGLFLGMEGDTDDYLQVNINYGLDYQWQQSSNGSGHFAIDLTPYRGQSIALDFGLYEGGDNLLGASGSFAAVDIGHDDEPTSAPVPEPATMLLLGTGLAGLAGVRKRNKSLRQAP